jgi:hypothetical protein
LQTRSDALARQESKNKKYREQCAAIGALAKPHGRSAILSETNISARKGHILFLKAP